MSLNFPDPIFEKTYTEAGITWTWNATLGVWSSAPEDDSGGANVEVGETAPGSPSDGDLWFCTAEAVDGGGRLYIYYNDGVTSQWVDVSQPGTGIEYLSKTEDDTAAGAITFQGRTTHEAGVRVAGGSLDDVFTGFYNAGGDLITTNRQFRVAQFGNSERSIGISCNPNDKMSNTEGLAISLIEATYGYGSHGVQDLSLFRGAYIANTNCKGSTNCFTAEFRVNQTGVDNRAVGFYGKVQTTDNLNGPAYNFYAEGGAPNYFSGATYIREVPADDSTQLHIASSSYPAVARVKRISEGNAYIQYQLNDDQHFNAGINKSGNFAVGLNEDLDVDPYFTVTRNNGAVSFRGGSPNGASVDIESTNNNTTTLNITKVGGTTSSVKALQVRANSGADVVWSVDYAGNAAFRSMSGALSDVTVQLDADDPAAYQTTYVVGDEGEQIEEQQYIGQTETLLEIIRDLRARVAALEGA